MLGHISSAYAAQVSPDLSLGSRFDFNVYSYESEWTLGAEWWLRRAKTGQSSDGQTTTLSSESPYDETGVVKARVSTSNVKPIYYSSL
jgi:mitochondrial distribution and morphology protein 10